MTWNLTVSYYGVNSLLLRVKRFYLVHIIVRQILELSISNCFVNLSLLLNNKFDKVFLVVDFNLPDFEWFNQVRLSSETIYWNVCELYIKRCMSYPSKQLSYT